MVLPLWWDPSSATGRFHSTQVLATIATPGNYRLRTVCSSRIFLHQRNAYGYFALLRLDTSYFSGFLHGHIHIRYVQLFRVKLISVVTESSVTRGRGAGNISRRRALNIWNLVHPSFSVSAVHKSICYERVFLPFLPFWTDSSIFFWEGGEGQRLIFDSLSR